MKNSMYGWAENTDGSVSIVKYDDDNHYGQSITVLTEPEDISYFWSTIGDFNKDFMNNSATLRLYTQRFLSYYEK